MTRLSDHTWIEDGYCYTTSHEVAAAWDFLSGAESGRESLFTNGVAWHWMPGCQVRADIGRWRIPISALPEVYGYREGEPGIVPYYESERAATVPRGAFNDLKMLLHLRAVIPCDGSGDALYALWQVIEEGT